jgi:hypothetical protein
MTTIYATMYDMREDGVAYGTACYKLLKKVFRERGEVTLEEFKDLCHKQGIKPDYGSHFYEMLVVKTMASTGETKRRIRELIVYGDRDNGYYVGIRIPYHWAFPITWRVHRFWILAVIEEIMLEWRAQ